jgi:hypothetical protein
VTRGFGTAGRGWVLALETAADWMSYQAKELGMKKLRLSAMGLRPMGYSAEGTEDQGVLDFLRGMGIAEVRRKASLHFS